MATITSASSQADIEAAYLDNCGYAEDGSSTMAKAFITACRAMLIHGITGISTGANRMQFEPGALAQQIAEAKRYVQAADGPVGGVIHADLRDLRT
jgi:hypothetical protein